MGKNAVGTVRNKLAAGYIGVFILLHHTREKIGSLTGTFYADVTLTQKRKKKELICSLVYI